MAYFYSCYLMPGQDLYQSLNLNAHLEPGEKNRKYYEHGLIELMTELDDYYFYSSCMSS